jgi:hypothetical protein
MEPFPSRCESAKRKAAGKLARGELRCYAKAAFKKTAVDATCVSRVANRFSIAVSSAGACPDGGGLQALVEDRCVARVVTTDGDSLIDDMCATTTTSTVTTTTVP